VLDSVRAWTHHWLQLISLDIDTLSDATWRAGLPVRDLFRRFAQVASGIVRARTHFRFVVH